MVNIRIREREGVWNRTARATQDAVQLYVPSSWSILNITGYRGNQKGAIYIKSSERGGHLLIRGTSFQRASHNVNDVISRLAYLLTSIIRSTPNGATAEYEHVNGIAWEEKVRVRIRWPWLILPCILLLFSLIFWIVTIVQSFKDINKIGIWNSSALAMLFNGPGEDI